MILQGRNLSLGMQGQDVLLLKLELYLLGYEEVFAPPRTHRPANWPDPEVYDNHVVAAVKKVQRDCNLPDTGSVDESTANCINEALEQSDRYAVYGRVFGPDGQQLPDVKVELLERDMPSLEAVRKGSSVLGENRSGSYGFLIPYSADQVIYAEAEPIAPDLQIRLPEITVDGEAGGEVVTSSIYYNASRVQIIDLELTPVQARQVQAGGLSEFELNDRRAGRVARGIPPQAWTDEDLAFLHGETGIPPEQLHFLKLEAEYWQITNLERSVYYGLLRMGLPTDLRLLLALSEDEWLAALKQALAQNIIPATIEPSLDEIILRLRQEKIRFIADEGQSDDPGINVSLKLALPDRQLRERFAREYINFQGDVEAFWQGLTDDPEFGPEAVAEVQFTLQLGALTANHQPLMQQLHHQHQTGNLLTMADIARDLTFDDWLELISASGDNNEPISLPPGIPGPDPEAKARVYASAISRLAELMAPTAALTGHLQRSEFDSKDDILSFLEFNPSFDLVQTPIRPYLAAHDQDPMPGVNNPEQAAEQIAGLQRLFKVTHQIGPALTLASDGVDSALAISRLGEARFVAQYGQVMGGTTQAIMAFREADAQAAQALTLFAHHNASFNAVSPWVIPGPPTVDEIREDEEYAEIALPIMPTLERLFGSLDYCECEHCRSVYSPAAYFTDILAYLDRAGLLDEIRRRRPDILHIQLSCENTNTLLPTIDLVNEVLEDMVARLPPEGPLLPLLFVVAPGDDASAGEIEAYQNAIRRYQTSGTPEQLLVFPEHFDETPYTEKLKEAEYPSSLPFDLWLEAAQVFLTHLGTNRYALRLAFAEDSAVTAELAQAHFNLSVIEWELISGSRSTLLSQVYGLSGAAAADPVSALRQVDKLLRHADITYRDLLELLATRFINPDQFYLSSLDEGCDPQNITLETHEPDPDVGAELLSAMLHKLHRLVRLRRVLGWSFKELDLAIIAVGSRDTADNPLLLLDEALLRTLLPVEQLRSRFNLPVEVLIVLWDEIDVRGEDALYVRLFQNKALTDLVNPHLAAAAVNVESADAASIQPEDVPTILAALQITAADYERLTTAGVNNGALSLENLSDLYRHVLLARTLALSIPDLLMLIELVDSNPFAADTAETAEFCDRVKAMQQSPFSLQELAYLFLHDADAAAALAPQTEEIISVGRTLRAAEALTDDLITQTLATALDLSDDVARTILEQVIAISAPGAPAFADFQLVPAGDELPEPQRQTYVRLHKAALLVQRFVLDASEVGQLHPVTGFDLNLLPVEAADGTAARSLFNQMEQAHAYVTLRNALPTRETRLIDVLTAGDETMARERLSALSGWDSDTFAGLTFEQLRTVSALAKLRQQLSLSKRLGVDPDQLSQWTTQPPDAAQVRQIQQVVKAKYDEERWLEVARPLQDQLRERRRDALVAFLLGRAEQWLPEETMAELERQGRLPEATMLYDRLLIDVEMNACQLTSRIKQASAVVQLFIQRCLMGLEGDNTIAPRQAREWQWMKNYRVWEANRKVFLYPENWIEPDLRDDKTPLFIELENALLQQDVTQENVETAVIRYLEQLNDVAKLEIVGMYVEQEEVDTLHVFGRTNGIPHRYYYRRRVREIWTPWEKVELDIEGDHLIPVIWNRRLYLFWPVFTEKSEEKVPPERSAPTERRPGSSTVDEREGDSVNQDERTPKRHWEIQLAFSEYKNGQWSARTLLENFLKQPAPSVEGMDKYDASIRLSVEKQRYIFFASTGTSSSLTIDCFRSEKDLNQVTNLVGRFILNDCDTGVTVVTDPGRGEVILPKYTFAQNNRYAQVSLEELREYAEDFALATVDNLFLPESSVSVPDHKPVLRSTTSAAPDQQFRLLTPHQYRQFNASRMPFFYQDEEHVFFVQKEIPELCETSDLQWNVGTVLISEELFRGIRLIGDTLSYEEESPPDSTTGEGELILVGEADEEVPYHIPPPHYIFRSFHHPFVCDFIRQLRRYGLDGFLDPDPTGEAADLRRQQRKQEFFESAYWPTALVGCPYPDHRIDFDEEGAYSQFNWELFFHIPLLLADRLMQNQRFAEAMTWFHYIFDPTLGDDPTVPSWMRDTPARFWKVRPFYEIGNRRQSITQLMLALNEGDPKLVRLVERWRQDPFNPHLIARTRHRSYMRTVVMKYLDNLIAWADHLFRQDTMETVAEAAQLYILAATILGPRPASLPRRGEPRLRTFAELLATGLDEFSNALVRIEEQLPAFSRDTSSLIRVDTPPLPTMLYFCLPPNDMLLGYWDTVADRLFKIRNCMNIEGAFRQLPLFEPPIDPALLVRARALGVDLRDVLSDGDLSLSPYRFAFMLQKANELCGEVKALGAALLSALEKRDAEELSQLRSDHEIRLLDAVRDVRKQQADEARETESGLEKQQELITLRRDFYRDIRKTNDWEETALALTAISSGFQIIANIIDATGGSTSLIPDVDVGISGWAGSPVVKVRYGGTNASNSSKSWSSAFQSIASVLGTLSSMSATWAGYERRWEEWKLQERMANKELNQIEKQMAAATIRLQIAEDELANHDLQRENAGQVKEFMRSKFTNRDLYNWMINEIAAIYFQSYQLALRTAQQAERAYQFERGQEDAFIRPGQWDSLRKGLLAGEQLQFDLRRLEMEHLKNNTRDFEIIKHISLVRHDPIAFITLKETGRAVIGLPEILFDQDFPGHLMRRIKSMSLTIPCVTGPYTNVNCTLKLLSSWVRTSETDGELTSNFVPTQAAIATSSAQNDSGLFELNFRDERYLPFEGAGAISEWLIEMPPENNAFDFDTISDVIIQMRYTAREGSPAFADTRRTALGFETRPELPAPSTEVPSPLTDARMFSLRHEFANEWHQFLHGGETPSLSLEISPSRFPYLLPNESINVSRVTLFLQPRAGLDSSDNLGFELTHDSASATFQDRDPLPGETEQTRFSHMEQLLYLEQDFDTIVDSTNWNLNMIQIPEVLRTEGSDRLNPEAIENVFLVCHYTIG
jgi:hypothetical protein